MCVFARALVLFQANCAVPAKSAQMPTPALAFIVHPPSGSCMSITLPHHSAVADVMTAVHDAHGLPPAAQVITFGGKPLIADTPLASLPLTHISIIRVHARLVGGSSRREVSPLTEEAWEEDGEEKQTDATGSRCALTCQLYITHCKCVLSWNCVFACIQPATC